MAALACIGCTPIACAQSERPIEILWYTYADPTSRYRAVIRNLAQVVHTIPSAAGVRWRISFFDPTSPRPAFERFNVLVIQSGEAFGSAGSTEQQERNPDFSGILGNRLNIERARGDRTVLTGADADMHAIGGATGNAPIKEGYRVSCDPPLIGRACWDGAAGHMINAINWAAGGRGLGIVSFVAAEFPNSRWWLHPDSFLRRELSGLHAFSTLVAVFGPGRRDNDPVIPAAMTGHPLNRGLTAKGMGNWNHSFHAGFLRVVPGYVPVVLSSRYPELALVIATRATR